MLQASLSAEEEFSAPFAIVFPGQGSQSIGMLKELSQHFLQVQQTFTQASSVLGYDLWHLVQNGPEQQLNQTEYTQPALLAADIAVWRCWQATAELQPSIMAGHSLGEYSALVCAGALDFNDAILLVAKRGLYMQQAVPDGIGAMAVIVGLDDPQIQQICNEACAADQILSPANFNAIGQTVVSGHATAVDRAINLAKNHKAKLATRIPVSVPSHCALMHPAAVALAKDLKNVHINKPAQKIIHNFDLGSHNDVDAIRSVLIEQLTHPVRWVETIQNMVQLGVQVMIECGPGKVLTGLNKRITSEIITYPTADLVQFNMAVSALRGVTACH